MIVKGRWLLTAGQFSIKMSIRDDHKIVIFQVNGCLIQVITNTGLTLHNFTNIKFLSMLTAKLGLFTN